MKSYKILTSYFGVELTNKTFQHFLKVNFEDISDFNIYDDDDDYLTLEKYGLELGFTNNEATVQDDIEELFDIGKPIFSHINIFSQSINFFNQLPFDITFVEKRDNILKRIKLPRVTKKVKSILSPNEFQVIDHYSDGSIIYSLNYYLKTGDLEFIQVRDNDIVQIKLE